MGEVAQEAREALAGMLFSALKNRLRKRRAPAGSLPLTIIGGFLGAGKTTLLNHLLAAPHGRRLCVLVNDFGRINIDSDLVTSRTNDTINLSNGCACCAVASDLTEALIATTEREEVPDAVVLEASGIADLNGIAQVALSNPSIRLDGRLTVVDAETLLDRAEDPLTSRLFRNQIAAADLVVLNKLDLIDRARRESGRKWLERHYPDKRVVEVTMGGVPPEVVLGLDASVERQVEASEGAPHADQFASVSVALDQPLDRHRLERFLSTLPSSLLRAKGVLFLAQNPGYRTIYQRVGERWRYTTAGPWADETPRSRLVFVFSSGRPRTSQLEEGLDACVASVRDGTSSKGPGTGLSSRSPSRKGGS